MGKGYIQIPDETGKLRPEHCVIMEKYIGRKLTKAERVHHINEDKADNRLENLFLCESQQEHMKVHNTANDALKILVDLGYISFKDGKYFLSLSNEAQSIAFQDILLQPNFSNIASRQDPDLKNNITKNIQLKVPICATNMSAISELEMLKTMNKIGGTAFIHRFMPFKELLTIINKAHDLDINPIIPSIGTGKEDYNNLKDLLSAKPHAILIDIAHGHSANAAKMLQEIKHRQPEQEVIVGNISTSLAVYDMHKLGADAIRVGIGGGSVCTTRKVTGHGTPTLTSLINCYSLCQKLDLPIIIDGGISSSGDIVKCLAFGANAVCIGNLLAGTSDTPGEIITKQGEKYKEYYGMSSKHKNLCKIKGERPEIAAEGIAKLIKYKGGTEDTLRELIGGIKSGYSYSGAANTDELRKKIRPIRLSVGAMIESKLIT